MRDINQNDSLVPTTELSNNSIISTKQNTLTINYLSTPFILFLLLDLLTFGWYRVYWFYDNWKAIKKSENSDISPFWRAILGIFFVDDIFRRIILSARNQGYKKSVPHRLLAITYIVLVVVGKLLYLALVVVATASLPTEGSQGALLLFSWMFICLKSLIFLPIQKAINFYNDKLEQERLSTIANQTTPVIEYFAISPIRFVIFDILTARMYTLYWFYKNWQAIKRAEHRNIRPFWRSVFNVFFIYALFKKIYLSAKLQNYPKTCAYGRLAIGYILVGFLLPFWSRLIQFPTRISELWYYVFILSVGVALDFLFLQPIQKVINFYNSKVNTNYKLKEAFSRGELVLLIIGGLFYVLLFTGKFNSSNLSYRPLSSKFAENSTKSWIIFQPESKNFEVKFPTHPIREKEELPINNDGLIAQYEGYESTNSQGTIYSVSQITYPKEIELSKLELKDFVDDVVASSSSNKLINSQNTYVGDHAAVDFLVQNRFGYMKGKIILIGQTKYMLMYIYTEGNYNEEDYKQFVNSLSLRG